MDVFQKLKKTFFIPLQLIFLFSLRLCAFAFNHFAFSETTATQLQPTQAILFALPENSSVYGQRVTFITNVVPVILPNDRPEGIVNFEIDNQVVASTPLANGTAKFYTTSINADKIKDHLISVIYLGNDRFSTSTDHMNYTVFPSNTSIMLTSNSNPSSLLQPLTFKVSVKQSPPSLKIPPGKVEFQIFGQKIGEVSLDEDGQALFSTSKLGVGNHRIQAIYRGDNNFNYSETYLNQQIEKVDASIQLESNPNPSFFAQEIVVTAKVISLIQYPKGNFQFGIDNAKFGSPILLDKDGMGSITINHLNTGIHEIQVYYTGDEQLFSTTAVIHQQVRAESTQTQLVSPTNPLVYGQNLEIIARVISERFIPSGYVQFYIDEKKYGLPRRLDADGTTALNISRIHAGKHAIEAQYLGDANSEISKNTLIQIIEKADSSISVTASEAHANHPISFIATVHSDALVDGTVQFQIDGKNVGNPERVDRNNQAFLTWSAGLQNNNQSVVAVYSGDENFNPSTSPPLVPVIYIPEKPATEIDELQENTSKENID